MSGVRTLLALRGCVAAVALTLGGPTLAQSLYQWETYDKRVDSAKSLVALGSDLFGDAVSLQTGALSFTVTDVDLPGNDGLPVRFTRSWRTVNTRDDVRGHMLADWDVVVPKLHGRFAPDWIAGTSTNRCSSSEPPMLPADKEPLFLRESFWQGVRLEIPGVSSSELLLTEATTSRPSDGATWRWTTGDGMVHLACLSTLQSGAGEGFVAVTADGTRYTFDRMAQRGLAPIFEFEPDPRGGVPPSTSLTIRENTLYVTRIEDRFSNWVEFKYSNSPTEPGRLTAIVAKDGRRIDIAWANGRIWKVTAGSRVWEYAYQTDGAGRPTLREVLLPDSTKWTIDFTALSNTPILYPAGAQERTGTCTFPNAPSNLAVEREGTVMHPSGATARFRIGLEKHGLSNVTVNCKNVLAEGDPPVNTNPSAQVNVYTIAFWDWSLREKSLTGPGLPGYTWSYSYEASISAVFRQGSSEGYPVCTLGPEECAKPTCTSDTCALTTNTSTTTTIRGPDNAYERYVFGNSWQYNEGKLLRVERGGRSIDPETGNEVLAPLENVVNAYDLRSSGAVPFPARFGRSLREHGDGFDSEFHRPQRQATTTRDGATFQWSIPASCGPQGNQRCFDAMARPTRIVRSSSLGHSKTETRGYFDLQGKWVMGQIAWTAIDGIETARATYHPTTAQMLTFSAFGELQQTLSYRASDGTVEAIADARDHVTSLSNWYRGVPRKITFPDGTEQTAVVNDRGWITSITDQNGFPTGFAHDAMGRITTVTPPSGDPVTWLSTSISYTRATNPDRGLPAGHWKRTESRGTYRKETWYDALWRPVMEREHDATNATTATATQRFRGWRHDAAGRVTFEGYPRTTAASIAAFTGITTQYDPLGRPTSVAQASELGSLVTHYSYLTGFITEITNPRGFRTRFEYQAFDSPDTSAPTKVIQAHGRPEQATTTIARNTFASPTSITRSGSWSGQSLSAVRRFVYDNRQRLCKSIEPDAGITVFAYHAGGLLHWSARGQSALTNTTTCQSGSAATADRSVHHYDALGRLLFVDHPAGTDDVGYTYLPDGLLHTATTGVLNGATNPDWTSTRTTWTYGYNRLRLPTSETLQVDGRSLAIGYGYNARGDRSSMTFPGGHSVAFDPNGLGQSTQAGAYATSVTWQPGGGLAGLTYGNQTVRTITANARQLPSRIEDLRAGVRLFDHSLSYDANGNLTRIIDGVSGAPESRTLGYDALDRLTSVSQATTGAESYQYDPLDNLRRITRGAEDWALAYHATTHRLDKVLYPDGRELASYAWNERGELGARTYYRYTTPTFTHPTVFRNGFDLHKLGSTDTFAFDRAGRMTQFAGQVDHVYDAHGRRVRTVIPLFSTRYEVYSRAGELVHAEDSLYGQRYDYVRVGGQLLAERRTSTTDGSIAISYLHSDHRGTPSARSMSGGLLDYRSVLAPYGAPYDGMVRPGPGFTGHVVDDASGLVYMQQRYYDPVVGRFLSTDPDPVSTRTAWNYNRYAYAHNNPYRFVDPDGRAACPKGSGGTCIDSPRTETGTAVQAGPSAQQQAVDGQVRSASRSGSLSDGTKLDFKGNEQGFKASADGTSSNPMETSCQACSDGSTREVGSYNLRALGPGESGGHTHTNRTSGLPGPEDGRMADATGRTAYVISPRGAYAIEKTDVGYRVRVLDGRRLDSSERRAVRGTIDAWNKNQGGSGVSSCVPTRC